METEAWRSITVAENTAGAPHVPQQKVTVYTSGVDEESPGYTRPMAKHPIVPMRDLVGL